MSDDRDREIENENARLHELEATLAEKTAALSQTQAALQNLFSSARCLLWQADIQANGDSLDWSNVTLFNDEEGARRFLPVEKLPDETYLRAWRRARHPEDEEPFRAYSYQAILANQSYSREFRICLGDGSIRWLKEDVYIEPRGPGRWHATGVDTDITERKQLEAQLLQAQKMEGIGRLAGGIAHDFNNLLTAITGYTSLAQETLPPSHESAGFLASVQQANDRASTLVSQLLAFARQQIIAPRVVSLNTLIESISSLLGRLLGETIEVTFHLAPDLWQVCVDPGQFEQILINLVVNARDAMSRGGHITVETGNIVLDTAYSRLHPETPAGEYVMFIVRDTGEGIPEALQAHIFEPFFTTKKTGEGTGLGLAMCHGIVKQSSGHIEVESRPGTGTTFKIYLPRTLAAPEAETVVTADRGANGTETLLVAEDDPLVRNVAVTALTARGYHVLEAESGPDALSIAENHTEPIHLLLTDVVMPQMSGKELAERLMKVRPGIKILYASGYTSDTIVDQGVLEAGIAFLQKPYSTTILAQKVRETLDA